MTDPRQILFTGGGGLLGGAMRRLMPEARFPSSSEFDVTEPAAIDAYVRQGSFEVLVHAAAYTSPPRVDKDPGRAIAVNIAGSANIVQLAMTHGLRLVYISTDYVFRGDQGNYREDDAVFPVNKYAWSKLGGECAVRMYDKSLIVRTSFGPNVFPYEKAFCDQWTSRECVDRFAEKLLRLVQSDMTGVVHVGGPRRTVHEYACSLDGKRGIERLSVRDVAFKVPVDTSLNSERYTAFVDDVA